VLYFKIVELLRRLFFLIELTQSLVEKEGFFGMVLKKLKHVNF
jgi:hypothetical protein